MKRFLLAVLALAAAAARADEPPPSIAGTTLLVAPTRVVLEGRTRSAALTLFNTGDAPAVYRLSLIHMRMTERGALEIEQGAPAPDERIADDLVRFSPRQVSLAAHETQTVRVQVRIPADLADGEYRSHLLFRVVPNGPRDAGQGPEGAFSIRLTPLVAVSIPVIVRRGETSAKADLSGARLVDEGGSRAVEVRLDRAGNRSLYGDLDVAWRPASGPSVSVGRALGVAVYVPNSSRIFRVPLAAGARPLTRGRLSVSFRDSAAKEKVVAGTFLDVP